ncbi:FAD-dependent oxidoreductase [Solwaraspora sp. WMMB335]|uniref:FAD-dependent oxidoreductase n=1 Tax=Solwaraspora sp. WMMB335 TaxID=3404118 RepID=UPI003B95A5A6
MAASVPDRAPGSGPNRRVLITAPVGDSTRRMLERLPNVQLREDLATRSAALSAVLPMLRPHTLVVGANAVDAAAIAAWVDALRQHGELRKPLIIRRGTSLASIDTVVAGLLGVDVVNTPEVNARYVAQFAVAALLDADMNADRGMDTGTDVTGPPRRPTVLGLIGAGAINGRVARVAAARGHHILVYTPSLAADPPAVQIWAAHHRVPDDVVSVAGDVAAVAARSDLLSIAVPMVSGGDRPTRHLVDVTHIKEFAGTRIVSVSEPGVFTESAVLEAYARRDLDVVFDNAPALVGPLRQRLLDQVPQDGGLRPGFTLSSAAMNAPGCAEELDQAVLTVIATAELAELAERTVVDIPPRHTPVDPATRRGDGREIVIVGGGIVGLTIALVLRTVGWRNLRVLEASVEDGAGSPGVTFGGADARHLSLTETVPYADGARRDVLSRAPADGGWQLRDPATLSDMEREWSALFEGLTDRPGLWALTTDLVVGLNQVGMRGWDALFARHSRALGDLRRDTRLCRCYLTREDFATGFYTQSRLSPTVRALASDEIARRWPALATGLGRLVPGAPTPRLCVHGAVEVDGSSVNIHQVAGAIGGLLAADGVEVHAGSAVRRLHDRPDGVELVLADGSTTSAATVIVTVGGRQLNELLGQTAASAGVVQQVLGAFITLPNPGLHHPLKVHAPEPVGVVNITLSPDSSKIYASGGFGYLGLAEVDPLQRRVADLTAALEDVVGRVFPTLRGPDAALKVLDRRLCERPMTPDGLPVLEPVEAFGGRVVVATGTNSAGTVEAPALGILLEGLLTGRRDVIHQLLHPGRASLHTSRWSTSWLPR